MMLEWNEYEKQLVAAVGTGFQLKSKFAYEGKPVELTVPGT